LSKEHIEKIRLRFIGLRVGPNHPMWKGGLSIMRNRIRQSHEYKNWRKIVYERDNFTCQMCFSTKKKLNCHHIETFSSIVEKYELKSYNEYLNCVELWSIDNGITLCKECHVSIKDKEKDYEEKFKNINYEKNKNVEVS
jgi:5-methylcytosine-specific restriction endonuclease McrA